MALPLPAHLNFLIYENSHFFFDPSTRDPLTPLGFHIYQFSAEEDEAVDVSAFYDPDILAPESCFLSLSEARDLVAHCSRFLP
jgi:hypothetical protein